MIKTFFSLVIAFLVFNANAQQTIDKLNTKKLNVLSELVVTDEVNNSHPCPSKTDTEMLAIASPVDGSCVHNTTLNSWLRYNSTTSSWEEMGGGGGISLWLTGIGYSVDDVVIESNNIYICLIAHTSSTFATDLAASRWLRVSTDVSGATGILPMANGGTDKNLTPVLGGVVYTDAGSMEVLGAGTSGQVLQSNGAAAPSFVNKSISGKAQNTAAVTVEETQVPNNLLTQTDSGKFLNETGNNNLLVNPSFEHSTVLTGWANSNGSPIAETTTKIHGAQSLITSPSATTFSVTQSSTLYASQLAGVQLLAMVRVRTSVSGVKVCSINDGTVSTTLCVDVVANSQWGLYKVPFVGSTTSNGISIAASSSITGNVYIDDAFVGAVDLKTDVDQSRIAGESYFAGTASCLWARTSATLGAFTASAACPGPTVNYSSMGTWATTDSDLPRQTITNLPAGVYKASFMVATYNSTAAANFIAINDGTTTCIPTPANLQTTSTQSGLVECVFTYTSSGTRVFELYGSATTGTISTETNLTGRNTKFRLEYFGSGQIYSASCGAKCEDTLSASITASGVVSGENVDFISGNCGVSTGVFTCNINTANLPLTQKLNCTGSVQTSGSATSLLYQEASSSTTVLSFVTLQDSVAAISKPFTIICQKTGADFIATRTITGSFAEVMTVPNVSKPKHCSFKITGSPTLKLTTCTTSPCNVIDNIGSCVSSATRSGTGLYALTFNSGFWTSGDSYNCNFDVQNWTGGTGGPAVFQGSEQTATVMNPRPFNTAAVDSAMTVNCSGF